MRYLTRNDIFKAALVVLFGFAANGLLGIIRVAAFAATFGASDSLDAFIAAQRIPEALFVLVAGGALGSAFIPVFSRYLIDEKHKQHAWKLASVIITTSASAAAGLSILVFLFAPIFITWYTRDIQLTSLTLNLMRIMLLTPCLFSISGLLMGVLNTHHNFILPTLAISMNNIGLIVGALFFAHILTPMNGEPNIYGLAIGAVLGAFLHLTVQIPGIIKIKSAYIRPIFNVNIDGVREVLLLMIPRVLGLAVVQINFIVNVTLSLPMVNGSTSALTIAWQLTFFSLGLIAQSLGVALFPTLSALAADNNMLTFQDYLVIAVRHVLFLSLPVSLGLILLGEPLIALIAQRGLWTSEATIATAWALSFFAVGITGHGLLEILSRSFYALSDTWTPVVVGICAMLANILLSVILIQWVGDPNSLINGPFAGLALANSLTTLVEAAVLWWLIQSRIGKSLDKYTLDVVWKTAIATTSMAIVILAINPWSSQQTPLIHLIGSGGLGLIAFFGTALSLRIPESQKILKLSTSWLNLLQDKG